MTTILIVDDDFDMRDSLVDILEDEGFDVAVAGDGLEALAYLRAHPAPDLILLDWMMPRCDGAQFRAQQQADPTLAAIPVILLTADTRMAEKMAALQVKEFLSKPVKLHRLLDVMKRYCRANT